MPLKNMGKTIAALWLVLAWQSPALSVEWVFEKVVDTDTLVPGKEVTFLAFTLWPSLDEGNVVFCASYHDSGGTLRSGIYAHVNGALKCVVDEETRLPGSSDVFLSFDMWPSMDGTSVAFTGSNLPVYFHVMGVYKYVSGSLKVVADADTPIPEGTGNFETTPRGGVSADGGVTAFYGEGESGQSGIYVEEGGVLKKVADETTPIPQGTGSFTEFENSTAISRMEPGDEIVAFLGRGQDGQEGIYKRTGSGLCKVADKNTLIPGGSGNFAEFGASFSISGGNVAFWAVDDGGREGIYKKVGGVLVKVADTDTPVPEGSGTFATFFKNAVSIYNRCVVFTAEDSEDRNGVYTDCFGGLRKVIDDDDTLDGKTFFGVSADRESFDDGCIAVKVDFDGGGDGVYLARPAPAVVPAVDRRGLALLILFAGVRGGLGSQEKGIEDIGGLPAACGVLRVPGRLFPFTFYLSAPTPPAPRMWH